MTTISPHTQHCLKNRMLGSNIVVNLVGIGVMFILIRTAVLTPTETTNAISKWLHVIFTPVSLAVSVWITLGYERPIRACIRAFSRGIVPPAETTRTAQRRLLNETFFLMGLDAVMWTAGTSAFTIAFWLQGTGDIYVMRPLLYGGLVGLSVVAAIFFIGEHILQERLAPVMFPGGGLSQVPGTIRLNNGKRLFALFVAINVIPLMIVMIGVYEARTVDLPVERLLAELGSAITIVVVLFMGIGFFLSLLVHKNLTLSLDDMVKVLQEVSRGRLDRRVNVRSNDEIGYAGDVVNAMTRDLRERERLKASLALAQEIQENLLPEETPRFPGLDIAGSSRYCEETGGDYFDFIPAGDNRLIAVVGDVSGHGASSALLMASARSALRMRLSLPGSLETVVGDVNRRLADDCAASGMFMTLFCLEIDPGSGRLRWVRAGHDPALVYRPGEDRFDALAGRGVALGVAPEARFEVRECVLQPGDILFVGTDGIWEATGADGEMFGRRRLKAILRENRDAPAADLIEAVRQRLATFGGDRRPDDDVTMLAVRFTPV